MVIKPHSALFFYNTLIFSLTGKIPYSIHTVTCVSEAPSYNETKPMSDIRKTLKDQKSSDMIVGVAPTRLDT
jgi:hypothetical protein